MNADAIKQSHPSVVNESVLKPRYTKLPSLRATSTQTPPRNVKESDGNKIKLSTPNASCAVTPCRATSTPTPPGNVKESDRRKYCSCQTSLRRSTSPSDQHSNPTSESSQRKVVEWVLIEKLNSPLFLKGALWKDCRVPDREVPQ